MDSDERDADPRATHFHVNIRREGRWRSLLISVGFGHAPTRFTFWRSTIFMVLLDVAILVLTIGPLYRDFQAGGISILVFLATVFALIAMGIGQYHWWRNGYSELFEQVAEHDDVFPEP